MSNNKPLNQIWLWMFRPVYRMMGALPEQQLRRWTARIEELTPDFQTQNATVAKLESEEQNLLFRGKSAVENNNIAEQRSLATLVGQCRRNLNRAKAELAVTQSEMAIIETRIHNERIRQRTQSLMLPSPADIAKEAAIAESCAQQIQSVADMTKGFEFNIDRMSPDEQNAIEEFKALAQQPDNKQDLPIADKTYEEILKKKSKIKE